MSKCPVCFSALDAAARSFVCVGTCAPRTDEKASAYRGFDVSSKPVFIVSPQGTEAPTGGSCPQCQRQSAVEVCGECHAVLPAHWRQHETVCVALAGARYSGKSVYIGVVVKQMAVLAGMLHGVFTPYDEQTRQLYTDRYERVLYEERGLMPGTPVQNRGDANYVHARPLVFRLAIPGRPPVALVLRDVAGEDLRNPALDSTMFSFFGQADGVIFLVDPMQVRAIREQLRGLSDDGVTMNDDPVQVLANVRRLQSFRGAHPVPVAAALSKFDAVQRLAEVEGSPFQRAMSNLGAAYRRDPSMQVSGFDAQDRALLDAEIRSLLPFVSGQHLLNVAQQTFPVLQWFAVSALGHQPNAGVLKRTGITPYRCLDPLKWILHLRGVL